MNHAPFFRHLSSPESLFALDSDAAVLGSLYGPRSFPRVA